MERKISNKGSLTIPGNLRRDLGIQGKEKINISVCGNGDLLVKRIAGTCVFCSSYEGIKAYKGRFVCKDCGGELGGIFDGK